MTILADIIDAAARFGWALFLLAIIGVIVFGAVAVFGTVTVLSTPEDRRPLPPTLDERDGVWAGDVEDAMWRHPSNAHIRKWDEEMGA